MNTLQAVLNIILLALAGYYAYVDKYDRATFYVVLALLK